VPKSWAFLGGENPVLSGKEEEVGEIMRADFLLHTSSPPDQEEEEDGKQDSDANGGQLQ